MDWVKLSARYYLDRAIVNFDDATEVMFTRALAYSGDQETHGFVPAGILPALCRRRRYETCVEALVSAGLWCPARGGYQITRWEEWQSELEAIIARRSADRDRKRRERQRQAQQHDHIQGFTGHADEEEKDQVNGTSRDMSAGLSAPREREKRDNPPHAPRASPPRTRGTRLPDDWIPTRELVAWARQEFPQVGSRYETDKFRDYWHAKAGASATKLDWAKTWKNWIRKAAEQQRPRRGRQAETDELFGEAMQLARKLDAQEAENDPGRNGIADQVRQSALPPAGD